MDIDISVCCIVYNQKDYINDMLSGILSQKFNGNYEIIIHDDASTDGTVDVLKEYKEKYPDKIKLVLEEENKYKDGGKMFYLTAVHAKGKYIAICEGDDYWCDDYKLQKQYDYLEKNNEVTYICHAAYMKIFKKERMVDFNTYNENQEVDLNEVLRKGLNFPTASLIVKKDIFDNLPEFYLKSPVEDEPLKLLCLSKGKGYYINEKMCVYRKNHPGSWNINVKAQTEKRLKHHEEKKKMYIEFNEYTKGKYKQSIERAILLEDFNIVMTKQEYKGLRNSKYKELINEMGTASKIRLIIAAYVPDLYKRILRIYKNFRA